MTQKFKQRKTRRGWETVSGWKSRLAGAALAAGMVMGATAYAQAGPYAPTTVAAGEDEPGQQGPAGPTHEFHIPAGTLTDALDAYHQATGLKVNFKIAVDQLSGFRTAGVSGTFTNSAALHQILDKTGLSFHFQGSDAVEIAIRNAEHVDVTSAISSVSLQQFTEPLLDTAQSVTVVPQYVMQEQAATGLRDSLRNAPGISIAAGEGGSQGDTLTIRGFNARNDIYLDGIRDFGSYYRDSFNYQAVNVLEGPASVEFGRGSTGGVVNQESKQPELNKFVTGGLQLGTNLMRRVTADVNEPIEGLGGAAFRVNIAAEQSSVAERDVTETRRFGIAPSLAFGLNTGTRAVITYLHESENSTPDYGLPYFGPAVAPVNRRTYYGFSADNYLRTNPDIITGKVDHDFGVHATVRNVLRFANYPRDVRITEPQVNTAATNATSVVLGAPITVKCGIGATPAASCYPINTDPGLVTVKRNQLTSQSVEDILWDQASVTGRFNIAHVENSAVVLVEGGRERSRPLRNGYTVPYVSLLNPNPNDPFTPVTTVAVRTYVESQSFGIDFLDTLKLRNWLQLSGGVRFDYFNTNSHSALNTAVTPNVAATVANRLDKQPTYRAAIVVKPRPAGSIYFDYGTSFNPAAESLSLSANNATSPPEYNETYEAGAKWNFMRDRLNVNGSVFRTEKLNARETDPNNSNNTINSGNQLVRGFQLGSLGHMPSHFDIVLGYAYLDGRVESSVVNGSPFASINLLLIAAHDPRANTRPYFINPAGFALANVPKNSGNLWLTHSLPWRFTGGVGGNYVGARRASSTTLIGVYNSQNPIDPANVPLAFKAIPGYAVVNMMLRRSLSDRMDFQVNVQNLANKFYIDQPHPNHLVPGEGLNAQFGVNYKF